MNDREPASQESQAPSSLRGERGHKLESKVFESELSQLIED